jgi:hypothetical protein
MQGGDIYVIYHTGHFVDMAKFGFTLFNDKWKPVVNLRIFLVLLADSSCEIHFYGFAQLPVSRVSGGGRELLAHRSVTMLD